MMSCEHGLVGPCYECDLIRLRAEVAALKARIAELESGQVNAAVEMCRRHCGTETFITVADWLASQV